MIPAAFVIFVVFVGLAVWIFIAWPSVTKRLTDAEKAIAELREALVKPGAYPPDPKP